MWTNETKKHNQISSHSNWPRVRLFDLAHKQCNGIIKEWRYCLTPELIEKFLIINILMFDSARYLVMAQIQFSVIKIIKIGRPERLLHPPSPFSHTPLRTAVSHFCLIFILYPLKVDVICVPPLSTFFEKMIYNCTRFLLNKSPLKWLQPLKTTNKGTALLKDESRADKVHTLKNDISKLCQRSKLSTT